jgi:RNA polymerase sigma-70 factor, ECF subfamily
VINTSLNVIRSRKRLKLTNDDRYFESPANTPAVDSGEELHARLAVALAQLRPEDAQVLVMRYLHDRTDVDIARLLGVTRGTVATRLFRARRRLRKLMEK